MAQVVHKSLPSILILTSEKEDCREIQVVNRNTDEILGIILVSDNVKFSVRDGLFHESIDFDSKQKLFSEMYASAFRASETINKRGQIELSFQISCKMTPLAVSSLLSCVTSVFRSLHT